MYKIKINNFEKKYLLEEMIKIFLKPSQYELVEEDADFVFNSASTDDKNHIKREIYQVLSKETGKSPDWGILTGIRPVKLWGETLENFKKNISGNAKIISQDDLIKVKLETRNYMKNKFMISDEKLALIEEIYDYQVETIDYSRAEENSVYIGIPFCPSRCLYCSFVSNQKPDSEIERYHKALLREIKAVGQMMKESGKKVESLYVGGGTPTTLSANQLDEMLNAVHRYFPMNLCKEITVEAGRPDTITGDKLAAIKANNVDRISINPQSMKDRTLELVGRSHNSKMIEETFELAKGFGFKSINGDLITGLPEESFEDFLYSVKKLNKLEPNNITIHCLAVKRASKLVDIDKDFHYRQAEIVEKMLSMADTFLREENFRPYYLYRQKHMAGAFENTGYCKDNQVGVYNMRIMDEHTQIVALGSGGISKAYFPEENRLERVPNVSNYEEYINRIDEMIERKRIGLFYGR